MPDLTIPPTILAEVDLEAAVDSELSYRQPYMPMSRLANSLPEHRDAARKLLSGKYRRGVPLGLGEVVQVPKRGGGTRPATVLDFETRVLYRGLTSLLEQQVPGFDRSYEEKRRFEHSPLEVEGCSYVVVADVSAFYDYVDHSMLEEEIVAQTGEAEVAELLGTILREVMGRRFGLPQVFHASDVLSEIYIDIAERRLIRDGLDVSRFNDDFRISAPTWRAANDALAALDREARELGLALNESKSYVLTRVRYETWVDEPNRRWTEINEAVDVDLRAAVSTYESEEDEEGGEDEEEEVAGEVEAQETPDEARLTAAAMQALGMALHPVDEPDRLQVEVNRQLAAASILVLTTVTSAEGLAFLRDFVSRERQYTDVAARYLISIANDHEENVVAAIEQLVGDAGVYLSPWQSMWLFEAVRALPSMSGALEEWIGPFVHDPVPDAVRARAALTLAEKERIGVDELASLYATGHRSSLPEVVAAVAILGNGADRLLDAIRRDDPMNGWIIDAQGA